MRVVIIIAISLVILLSSFSSPKVFPFLKIGNPNYSLPNPTYIWCNNDNDCANRQEGHYCLALGGDITQKACRPCTSTCDCQPNQFCANSVANKYFYTKASNGYCFDIESYEKKIGQPCQNLQLNNVKRGVNDKLFCGLVTNWDINSMATEAAWQGFCDRNICKLCSESSPTACAERKCINNHWEVTYTAQMPNDIGHILWFLYFSIIVIVLTICCFCCTFCCCTQICSCFNLCCGCCIKCFFSVCCTKTSFVVKPEKSAYEDLSKKEKKEKKSVKKIEKANKSNKKLEKKAAQREEEKISLLRPEGNEETSEIQTNDTIETVIGGQGYQSGLNAIESSNGNENETEENLNFSKPPEEEETPMGKNDGILEEIPLNAPENSNNVNVEASVVDNGAMKAPTVFENASVSQSVYYPQENNQN